MNEVSLAIVCSSNMNRSMEAHNYLAKKKFKVRSFGTGEKVKLPGMAMDKPNVYEFGTSYNDIYEDLLGKEKNFYTQNGLLHMLDRNRRIKTAPERFQACEEKFDVIITCEERVYDQVIDFLDNRENKSCIPVHVLNIDIPDNHDEAVKGSFLISDLATMLTKTSDLDDEIDEVCYTFETENNKNILHCIMFY